MSLEVGQAMLRWVYTDQCDMIHSSDDTFVLSLLAVAKKYRLDPLANRQDVFSLISDFLEAAPLWHVAISNGVSK